ncbi:MAG: 3-phosphoshikimate 1-carboxyvinyltransferase [Bacteroidota bacterium]
MKISLSGAQAHSIRGTVKLPYSKSISNRLLMLRELCKHSFHIINLSDAADTVLLAQLLSKYKTTSVLDAANAGTVLRFMTALLAVSEGEWELTGSARMLQRPIAPLVDALKLLGAHIDYNGAIGFPPIKISGKKIDGGSVEIDAGSSSQFVSALLLIAPFLPSGMVLNLKGSSASAPYIDMTIALLRQFNVTVEVSDSAIHVQPGCNAPEIISVEPDWSSASYWYCAAALSPDAEIQLPGLSLKSTQGDCILASAYSHFGVETLENAHGITLRKSLPVSAGFSFDFSNCPDLFPAIAVSCAALGVEARLSGLKNLRIKESDRVEAVSEGLEKCGAHIAITGNHEMMIYNDTIMSTEDVLIRSYDDHRIAMAFAQLVWLSGNISIDDISVCTKSYPGFVKDMETMGAEINA